MNSSQSNIKLGHNYIKALVKPIEPPCTKPTKHADYGLNKGDHLQIRLNLNMEAWQDYEKAREDPPATYKQNRNPYKCAQTAEQQIHQTVCQLTLQAMARLAWCTLEHENPRDGIFRHERRSQHSELAQRVLTEPTRSAPRSRVRQLFDSG